MAIIRNERTQRPATEVEQSVESEEEEIDYRWHPTEEEFTSPLTADQWAELFNDASFVETDAAKAVRCLRDYGGPATFQQLSIRYRGTMGRYRRWLGQAAQSAGERFGVSAPQKDQFGMDEWWPLLYVMRATGKPGAGVFEMMLRPEVEEAFHLIDEQEKQAKRAENARQLQRIEQLERARREERERRAAEAAEAAEAAKIVEAARALEEEVAEVPDFEPEPVVDVEATAKVERVRTVGEVVGADEAVVTDVQATQEQAPRDVVSATEPSQQFPALNAFLDCMAKVRKQRVPQRRAAGRNQNRALPFDVTGPIDYALRYADRLRGVLAILQEGYPNINAATLAREAGDETVRYFQDVLNGQEIPSFAYLEALKNRVFINPEYLEVPDGMEEDVPVFCTYEELLSARNQKADLSSDVPCEIVYVVDDSKQRRSGVILCFSPVRCVLLSRTPVLAERGRRKGEDLRAFAKMVEELDDFALREGIERTSFTVRADEWDDLAAGRIWPGTLLSDAE